MSTYFNISLRREEPDRYDQNREINTLIQKNFKDSVSKFLENPYPVYDYSGEDDFNREWNSPKNKDIPYSSSTLGESGCAVYVFHQGLRYRKGSIPSIEQLAQILAENGYYEPGKGTWHCLFDHWGLRRASNIKEIFDTLDIKELPLITILVSNQLYPVSKSGSGSHFVNIVGVTQNGFLIDDPNKENRLFLEFERVLPSVQVAWLW